MVVEKTKPMCCADPGIGGAKPGTIPNVKEKLINIITLVNTHINVICAATMELFAATIPIPPNRNITTAVTIEIAGYHTTWGGAPTGAVSLVNPLDAKSEPTKMVENAATSIFPHHTYVRRAFLDLDSSSPFCAARSLSPMRNWPPCRAQQKLMEPSMLPRRISARCSPCDSRSSPVASTAARMGSARTKVMKTNQPSGTWMMTKAVVMVGDPLLKTRTKNATKNPARPKMTSATPPASLAAAGTMVPSRSSVRLTSGLGLELMVMRRVPSTRANILQTRSRPAASRTRLEVEDCGSSEWAASFSTSTGSAVVPVVLASGFMVEFVCLLVRESLDRLIGGRWRVVI
mmetsp:Transcript_38105/g.93432  ORF Transcript_38105/g.93432 Transcript_38105/m.93432 type:complete len:346 (-) Transcript_38105:98-1135(-)